MIVNGQRFTPPSLRSQQKKVAIRPKSGIMSLSAEPADPEIRAQEHLAPKSYADAAEEALETAGDGEVDEEKIKETPPRPTRHSRQTSEPRPLGEMMDEVERAGSPNSPSLRHTRGRLEQKESWEAKNGNANGSASYAGAVKDFAPAKDSAVVEGNGVPPDALNVMTNGNGTKTPETFEAVGEDESPRSPVRKGHKRVSSKSLKEMARKQAQQQTQQAHQEEELSPRSQPANTYPSISVDGAADDAGREQNADEKRAEPGQLIYENLRNKSGENLASIKPSDDYRLSLQHRRT